jgi:hypothetical protein
MLPQLSSPPLTTGDNARKNTPNYHVAALCSQWNAAQDDPTAVEAGRGLMELANQDLQTEPWGKKLPHISVALKASGVIGGDFAAPRAELLKSCLDSASAPINWKKEDNNHPDNIRAQMLLHLYTDKAITTEETQKHLRPALVRLAGASPEGAQAALQYANTLASSDTPEIAAFGQRMQHTVAATNELRQTRAYFDEVVRQQTARAQSEMTHNEQIGLQVKELTLPAEVREQLRVTAMRMGDIALECGRIDPVAALPHLREVSGIIRNVVSEAEQAVFLEKALLCGVEAKDPAFVLQMAARRVALPCEGIPPVVIEALERCITERQNELVRGVDPEEWTQARSQMQDAVALLESMAQSPNPVLVQKALEIAMSEAFFKLEPDSAARIVLDVAALQGTTRTQVNANAILQAGKTLLAEEDVEGAMEAVTLLQNLSAANRVNPQAVALMKAIGEKQMEAVWEVSPENQDRMAPGDDEWNQQASMGLQMAELDALHEIALSLKEMKANAAQINDLREYGGRMALACAQEHAQNGDWASVEALAGMMDKIHPGNHAEERQVLAQTALRMAVAAPSGDLGAEEDLMQRLEALEAALALADPKDKATRQAVLQVCDQLSNHTLLKSPATDQMRAVAEEMKAQITEIQATALNPSAAKNDLYDNASRLNYPSAQALAFATQGRLRPGEQDKVGAFADEVARAVEQAYNELSLMDISNWDGRHTHLGNLEKMQNIWAEAGTAVETKVGCNPDARAALYFELMRLSEGGDFQPSDKKKKDAAEVKYFKELTADCVKAYPPDGVPDDDPTKRQKFIQARITFHSNSVNAKATTLGSDKGLKMLSARAGYLIEERTYQLLDQRKVLGWDDQNTKVLGSGTRPDVTLPLGGKRYALLDITASKSTGHILDKTPSWTNKPRIPAAIEVTYPSFDSKNLVSLLLDKKGEFPGNMAQKRAEHLQALQQQQDDNKAVLKWLRDLRDQYGQSAVNKVCGSKYKAGHVVASTGTSNRWTGLPEKLPRPHDADIAKKSMEALEATFGPNPITQRNAQQATMRVSRV